MPCSPPVAKPCTMWHKSNRIGAHAPMTLRVGRTEVTRDPAAIIVTAMVVGPAAEEYDPKGLMMNVA